MSFVLMIIEQKEKTLHIYLPLLFSRITDICSPSRMIYTHIYLYFDIYNISYSKNFLCQYYFQLNNIHIINLCEFHTQDRLYNINKYIFFFFFDITMVDRMISSTRLN
jgi:hypothetical protein